MNTLSIGSALVPYMQAHLDNDEADIYLVVFIGLGNAEHDVSYLYALHR
jgi:hypothetical protein